MKEVRTSCRESALAPKFKEANVFLFCFVFLFCCNYLLCPGFLIVF